jgi:hypothetical protein
MSGLGCRQGRSWTSALLVVGICVVMLSAFIGAQNTNVGSDTNDGLTYARGQSVIPVYSGWSRNADGSFDMHFAYLNRNWVEELEIPIGENNNMAAPFGPDAGQPTHFYPRNNRWQFKVRVPADFGSKELIWTLTSYGQTYRAYGVLKPGYIVDQYSIQHEFCSDSTHGRTSPTVAVEGAKMRTTKVGVPVQLVAIVKDDNPVRGRGGAAAAAPAPAAPAAEGGQAGAPAAPQAGGRGGRGGRGVGPRGPLEVGPGPVGGGSIRTSSAGLRFVWFSYRGAGVTFDPPQFKSWEDPRFGSPWAPDWVNPPIPDGNRWVVSATFKTPGTYVLRAQGHNGSLFTNEDITVNVTP